MSAATGYGRCQCGWTGEGRIIGEVDQGNGGGCTAIVCGDCDRGEPPVSLVKVHSRVEEQLARYRRGNG